MLVKIRGLFHAHSPHPVGGRLGYTSFSFTDVSPQSLQLSKILLIREEKVANHVSVPKDPTKWHALSSHSSHSVKFHGHTWLHGSQSTMLRARSRKSAMHRTAFMTPAESFYSSHTPKKFVKYILIFLNTFPTI